MAVSGWYWPLHAAIELGQAEAWPAQYLRAAPAGAPARKPMGEMPGGNR